MKITINWVTRDWNLIRRLREKYRLPQYMNVNGLTEAEVDEETLSNLRKGEPKYLIIRKMKGACLPAPFCLFFDSVLCNSKISFSEHATIRYIYILLVARICILLLNLNLLLSYI